ncbi:hypothetical protein O3M35_011760 [Rhynocoris fuscipes]|uniref:Uncharacterized protein n=1 Tax=Rhynocoris fuscipes TaxID=488301 RepID=A0AAW1CEJ3_9HEMI
MALPILDRSVCGLSIKTGSLIIGYLSLAHAILSIIQVVSYTVVFAEYPQYFENFTSSDTPEFDDPSVREKRMQLAMSVVISIIVACVIFAVANLIIDILFVVGIHKKRPNFMLPWIVLSGVGCVLVLSFLGLGAVGLVITFVQALISGTAATFFSFLAVMILYTMLSVISIYCFIIVYSYYRTTKDQISASRSMQYSKM